MTSKRQNDLKATQNDPSGIQSDRKETIWPHWDAKQPQIDKQTWKRVKTNTIDTVASFVVICTVGRGQCHVCALGAMFRNPSMCVPSYTHFSKYLHLSWAQCEFNISHQSKASKVWLPTSQIGTLSTIMSRSSAVIKPVWQLKYWNFLSPV